MNRSATASLHSATPKKNVPCFSDMVVVKFFLKKERTFFFGVLPSKYSGRWRNNADEVLAKLFFGERICQSFGSFVFEFGCRKWKRRGLGRNFPFAPLFVLGEFGADKKQKNQIQYCASTILLFFVHDLKGSILGIRLGHFR